jgi:hypothetical protein
MWQTPRKLHGTKFCERQRVAFLNEAASRTPSGGEPSIETRRICLMMELAVWRRYQPDCLNDNFQVPGTTRQSVGRQGYSK